jgi:hypothetical protein
MVTDPGIGAGGFWNTIHGKGKGASTQVFITSITEHRKRIASVKTRLIAVCIAVINDNWFTGNANTGW